MGQYELFIERIVNEEVYCTDVVLIGTREQCMKELRSCISSIHQVGFLVDDLPDVHDPVKSFNRIEQSVFTRLGTENETHTKFVVCPV
ncbi:MAG: hypothetical protein DRJ03_23525 [Chloroflexi bacterium]|nr:MAG: hypothetical protein DRJ03_23525 [Chloroflexota bacterium]